MGIEGPKPQKDFKKVESKKAEPRPKRPNDVLTRRGMLKGLGVSAAVGVAALTKHPVLDEIVQDQKERAHTHKTYAEVHREEVDDLNRELEAAKPELFSTGDAKGIALAPFEAMYFTGHPGGLHRLDESIELNGPRAYNALHQAKLKLLAEHGRHDDEVEQDAVERPLEYARRWNHPEQFVHLVEKNKQAEALGRMTLEQVNVELEAKLHPIRQYLSDNSDANKMQARSILELAYGLMNEESIATFRALVHRISTQMMLAYSMTELLGSLHGERNKRLYNFMLMSLGKEFLAGVPSEGDLIPSRGEFQMTNKGVHDTSSDSDVFVDRTIVRAGASIPNSILPDHLRLPKNLKDLHSYDDHALIAFLYAVNVLGSAAHHVQKNHPQSYFKHMRDMSDTNLMSFIATSHNSPARALKALDSFVKARAAGDTQHSFRDYCDHLIRPYADKSIANFDALDPDSDALAEVEHRKVEVTRDDKSVDEAIRNLPSRREGERHKNRH